MNVIFRDWGNKQLIIKDVLNVAVSTDQDGVVIETEKFLQNAEALKKAGFNFVLEGKLLRVSCQSIFAC